MAERPAPTRRTGAQDGPRGGRRRPRPEPARERRGRRARGPAPEAADDQPDGPAGGDGASAGTPAEGPRWGGGDVALGIAVAIAGSTVALYVVVALSGYAPFSPGPGTTAGWLSGRQLVGQAPEVLDTLANLPIEWRLVSQLGLWIGLIGVPLFAVARKGTSLREDLGLRMAPRDVPLGLALGVGLQLLAVPLLYLPIFWLTGEQDVGADARDLVSTATGAAGIALLFLVVGVGAPFAEELFYRGLAQRSFARRIGRRWAIVAAAVLFALMHLQELQLPALVLVGVVCGWLADRYDRLGPAIWTHVGFNLVAAAVLVWGSPWG